MKLSREQSSKELGGKWDLILFVKGISEGLYLQNYTFLQKINKVQSNYISFFLSCQWNGNKTINWQIGDNLMIDHLSPHLQNLKHYLT